MKKIKTTSYKALCLIFAVLSTASTTLTTPSVLGSTLQFTKSSTLVDISVNFCGTQIATTNHDTAIPKITFEIPKSKDQWHFDVLISSAKIDFQLKQFPEQDVIQNTVDYLKIDPQASYKYYTLDFIDGVWVIEEKRLQETGRIPDRTIIIECYPEWIQDFKGGSQVEFPTLYLNNAIADLGATEEDFKEALVKLELAALDSKIIHSPVRRKTQAIPDKKRVLIMDVVT
jgi:hypothetical protein